MKAQSTLEFMMIFLITMAAIMMIFQPIAKTYKEIDKRADFVMKKQQTEDRILSMEIYCNTGGNTVMSGAIPPGCKVTPYFDRIEFECTNPDGTKHTINFPTFFESCEGSNVELV